MKGWGQLTIGDVCQIVNGGTPKTGVKDYWDGEFQWVTPAEMGKLESPYLGKTQRTITGLGMQNSSARLLPPNSVILSSRAPIGHLVINTVDMATNQGCKGLIPSDRLNTKFLYYYLSSIVDLLNDLGTGATFKELSSGKLKEVSIPLPPLPEQRRIVAILDQAFDGIATAQAHAERNLANARAVFEEFRNKLFTGADSWASVPISRCFKLKSGDFLPSKNMASSGNVPVYGGNGLAGIHEIKNLSGINVVIGRVGAKCGNVRVVEGEIWLTDNALYISEYLLPFDQYFVGKALEFLDLRRLANQTAQPVISYATVKNTILRFPADTKDQRKIADELNSLESETESLSGLYCRKLAALAELKAALLYQAFSGQL